MLRLFFVCGLLSYRDIETEFTEGYPDRGPVIVSVAAGRIVREIRKQDAPMLSRFAQQLRQLGDVGCDPSRLVAREQLG